MSVSGLSLVLIVILVTGVLGGTRNWIAEETKKDWPRFWQRVLEGVIAAATIPLFLSIVGNDKITKVFGTVKRSDPDCQQALLILVGFCALASVFSRKFLDSLSRQIIRELNEKVDKAEADAEQAKTMAEVQVESDGGAKTNEAIALRAPDDLDPNERAVLAALLSGPFLMRSIGGLAESTHLDRTNATAALEALAVRGDVQQITTSKGERWALTDGGKAAAARAVSAAER